MGNIIGSAISNILGAFSLGLLFRKKGGPAQFDRSSRIYSLLLLVVTTFVAPIAYFPYRRIWLACGTALIAFFAAYVISIGWAISKGRLTAPEDSDYDSDEDDSGPQDLARTSISQDGIRNEETDALLDQSGGSATAPLSQRIYRGRHSLQYQISYQVFGFLGISLAGYVLSHAATNITDTIGLSDVLFGVIILAFATTLPEKFVAVMSGHQGQTGVLVANTAGSNMFLLTLCMGIIMIDTGELSDGNVKIPELAVLWCSTFAFTLTVWLGGRLDRLIGGVMLAIYIAFIVLEFTVNLQVVCLIYGKLGVAFLRESTELVTETFQAITVHRNL